MSSERGRLMDGPGPAPGQQLPADTFPAREPGLHGRDRAPDGGSPGGPGPHRLAQGNDQESPVTDVRRRDGRENEAGSPGHRKGSTGHRTTQVEATLKWLEMNYERADGVCLPRCVLYGNYLTLCKARNFNPLGAATFGKLMRRRFPGIRTRRLGTRGQSKYHYFGIGIKTTSPYYHAVYSGRRLTRFSGTKVKTEGSHRKYLLSSKTRMLLPVMPTTSDLPLRPGINKEKVDTFCLMYHTHCQRVLDIVITANFQEVQTLFVHFWQGLPGHLEELLSEQVVVDLVTICDSVLYKVLGDVLMPATLQELSGSLYAEIGTFVRHLPTWLKSALENIPEIIAKSKIESARRFALHIRRQISFIQLAQTSRTLLQCPETVDRMLCDLDLVEFDRLSLQVATLQRDSAMSVASAVQTYVDEFRNLLRNHPSVEAFIEWLDLVVDTRVLQGTRQTGSSRQSEDAHRKLFQSEAASFLLHWSIFSSFILRDLTLSNARSFGAFHVLYMTFNEYFFLIMETQRAYIRDTQRTRHVTCLRKNSVTSQDNDDVSLGRSNLHFSPHAVTEADSKTTNQDGGSGGVQSHSEPRKNAACVAAFPATTYAHAPSNSGQYLHPLPVKLTAPSGGSGDGGATVPDQPHLDGYHHLINIAHAHAFQPHRPPPPDASLVSWPSQAPDGRQVSAAHVHAQNTFSPLLVSNGFAMCGTTGNVYSGSSTMTSTNGGLGKNEAMHTGYAVLHCEKDYHGVLKGVGPFSGLIRRGPYLTQPHAEQIAGGSFGMAPYGRNETELDHTWPPCGQFGHNRTLGNAHQVELTEVFPARFPNVKISRSKSLIIPSR